MQLMINATADYCKKFDMIINVGKTNYMIFSKGKIRKLSTLFINQTKLEKVNSFCYLGIIFKYNNTFELSIQHNIDKARKALFKLDGTISKCQMPIVLQLYLFDCLIKPILLYGCEIWGMENFETIEIFYRNFLRRRLKLGRHVPKPMVYGEFGKSELKYTIWQRMLNFWKGLTEPENKLSNLILSKKLFDQQDKWNIKIKSILISLGVPYVFEHVELISRNQLKEFTNKATEEFVGHLWCCSINSNSITDIYRTYKHKLQIECYISTLRKKDAISLSHFRCASSTLPVVRAKFGQLNLEKCPFCNQQTKSDEYHLLLLCNHFKTDRQALIDA